MAFGGLFEVECGEDSAASRLGARFSMNPGQELHERNNLFASHLRQPGTFDMSELLNQISAEDVSTPAQQLPVEQLDHRAVVQNQTNMAEAAGFAHVYPEFTESFMGPPLAPLGEVIDFHYANFTLPPMPLGPAEERLPHNIDEQVDIWDDKLLSLSWHEALEQASRYPAVSDLSEIPFDEAVTEFEGHDEISADFWANQLRMGSLHSTDMESRFPPYEYEFEMLEDETMRDAAWAMAEGLRALAAGDVPTAVFLLETAVRSDPNNAEAWYQLGTAQQLNENDKAAISALGRCLFLDSKHPLARIALAASFTNELRRADAQIALAEWSDLHLPDTGDPSSDRRQRWQALADYGGYTFQHELYVETEARLLRILENSPSEEVVANVEAALGILYNVSEEYEKAAIHFERAIIHRPDDAVLYNRLGASLANGDRNADAIAAYCRALELSPGLLRTRYNLGIASCNMHAYKEAIQHFLSVLNKQNDSRSAFVEVPPPRNGQTGAGGGLTRSGASSSVWASLRMAFLAMDRRDLYDMALDQKLPELNAALSTVPDDTPTSNIV